MPTMKPLCGFNIDKGDLARLTSLQKKMSALSSIPLERSKVLRAMFRYALPIFEKRFGMDSPPPLDESELLDDK